MAEEKLSKAEEPAVKEAGYDLCLVLDYSITMLKNLQKIDFTDLYDDAAQDKIRCVTGFYDVIAATQKALIKQVKS